MPMTPSVALSPLARRLELPARTATLDNGLRLLLLEDATVQSLAVSLIYQVGSRNEQSGRTGLAHFFEHMMFNGSRGYGPGAFDRIMEAHGGSNNAYTTRDVTVYQDWCPPEALDTVLALEADRMGRLSIDPAMVESERGVVANERRRYMAEPEAVLDELLHTTAFRVHPYRWPILGWLCDIESWTIADVEGFFEDHYGPNNALLVIVGAAPFEETRALVERHFGGLAPRPCPAPPHEQEPPQRGERRAVLRRREELAQLHLGWHAPNSDCDDGFALCALERILLYGQSSRLHQRLVERDELCLEIGGGVDSYSLDPSLFTLRAHLRKGVSSAALEDALRDELATLRRDGVRPDELEKARNQTSMDFIRSLKTISGKAELLGAFEVFGGGWRRLPEALARHERVGAEDIARVVERYFSEDNLSSVELRTEREPTTVDLRRARRKPLDSEATAASSDPADDPKPGLPLPLVDALKLPPSERFELDNGLIVRVIERRGLPLLTLGFSFEAGGRTVADGQEGLAPLVARLCRKGTARWSEDELNAEVDARGAYLGATVGKYPLTLVGEFLSTHLSFALDLLAEVVRRPRFELAAFDKQKRRSIDALLSDRSSARAIIDRFMVGALLANHPLGRPTSGDERSLEGLTHAQVVAHHAARFQPTNATLVVVGDVSAEELRAELAPRFGDWRGPPRAAIADAPPPPPLEGNRVLFVEKPDADEVVFQFGRLSIPRVHPDYPFVSLLNILLGGRFTSRLNTALRIREGLTYGVGSGVLDLRELGVFRVDSFSGVETAERALDLALEVCRRFHHDGIDSAELSSARATLRGQLPTDLEAPEQLAELQLFFERRGLDNDHLERCFERVDALELDAANKLIRRHFSFDEPLQFVLIGDPAKIGSLPEKYGRVTRVSISDARFTAP